MGKLRPLSAREVMRILADNGFVEVRQRGSHIVMQRQVDDTTATVIVPNHRHIRIGTLSSIIRQSGLPRSKFE